MLDESPGGGAGDVADWLEAALAASGRPSMSTDALMRYGRNELGQGDHSLALALQRMSIRAKRLSDRYPFDLNELGIRVRRAPQTQAYLALLMLTSSAPFRRLICPTPTQEMDLHLDSIVEDSAARFWGERGRALRFAWPSSNGRPVKFADAIDWLAGRIGVPAAHSYRPPLRKDGGVDVISWLSFGDHRRGVPILLVQSTVQADLLMKASDIETRVWASWLQMDTDPVTALAVPQYVEDATLWHQIAVKTLPLDRGRLVALSSGAVRQDVSEWLDDAEAQLSQAMVAGRI